MKKYKVYACLIISGKEEPKYVKTVEADSEQEAMDYAYDCAMDLFESYKENLAPLSFEDHYHATLDIFKEKNIPKNEMEQTIINSYIQIIEPYIQIMEPGIEYYVKEV